MSPARRARTSSMCCTISRTVASPPGNTPRAYMQTQGLCHEGYTHAARTFRMASVIARAGRAVSTRWWRCVCRKCLLTALSKDVAIGDGRCQHVHVARSLQ
eukprot:m.1038344 g.1038344  ORF g.1038344 m.1038344 type:complete len:101 (-) comp24148_c0_seq16:1913-2215(-)